MTVLVYCGMTAPSRHAGPDPASPVLQKSKRARSRLRAQRDDISGVLRDDRMGAVNGMMVSSGHPEMLLVRITFFPLS